MLCGLSMLTLTSCGGSTVTTEELRPVQPASMFVEHDGSFCDDSGKDKFSVGYYGLDPLDTLMYLYIICHQKDTVYRAVYPGDWFLGNGVAADSAAQITAVHNQMHALVEGKLMPPADSLYMEEAFGRPMLGIYLPGHVMKAVYYSQLEKTAIVIE